MFIANCILGLLGLFLWPHVNPVCDKYDNKRLDNVKRHGTTVKKKKNEVLKEVALIEI